MQYYGPYSQQYIPQPYYPPIGGFYCNGPECQQFSCSGPQCQRPQCYGPECYQPKCYGPSCGQNYGCGEYGCGYRGFACDGMHGYRRY